MVVGVLTIEILIFSGDSLKEKRFILRSMKDRLKKKFNISIAELNFQEKLRRSEIGIALIGNQMNFVENSLQKIFNYLDNNELYEIINYRFEYF